MNLCKLWGSHPHLGFGPFWREAMSSILAVSVHFGGKPGRSIWAGSVHFGGFSQFTACMSEFNRHRQMDDGQTLKF
jgi:hypothetical protein